MMTSLLLALALLTQAEPPPRPQDPSGRPERRDPFEGPRQPQPPTPPQPPRGERRPVQPPGNAEELQSWLRENEPETFRRLMELQQEGRRPEVARMLEDASTRMRELAELKQRDPKGFEKMMDMRRLERESIEEAEAARRAGPEEREAAMKKLKETLGKLFDAREEIRVRELAELKRRVEALEKALTNRKAAKDRLVEKRSRELMGEKSDEDW
jgi:hypothetical protein